MSNEEITFEQVMEYCKKRNLDLIDQAFLVKIYNAKEIHLKHVISISDEALRLLEQDDGFANYMKKVIQEEIDRRMKEALLSVPTQEKE